eukprot:TRINITY_DN3716_c0_g1_i2.p1 TRINITY_DN3716_c0_g1~~TRINITY_DN3716_c0_g1_i2.p1  ORF type:complete len:100 (+),score=5.21 TRINITY_DN3716_c0_g1_i2:276-575(+)
MYYLKTCLKYAQAYGHRLNSLFLSHFCVFTTRTRTIWTHVNQNKQGAMSVGGCASYNVYIAHCQQQSLNLGNFKLCTKFMYFYYKRQLLQANPKRKVTD